MNADSKDRSGRYLDGQSIKILSVEDNPGDVRLLQEVLKGVASFKFEWISVANLENAIQTLADAHFDVILLDLSLPDSFGIETLGKIKPHAPGTPIVIMTGVDNEKIALDAVREGEQDYLVKGHVDGNTLSRVMRYAIQRKQSQEALQESEERFSLAVKGSNDGVWDWNLKTNQIYLSPRWKEILGYTDGEITNTPEEWMSRIHHEDLALVKTKITDHLKGLTPNFKSEYRIRHKNESFRWVLSQGLAIRDAKNQAYRMAGSQTDVTDRKQAEDQLAYNAFHDSLTGLPSRPLFINRLRQALQRLQRVPDYIFAVLFLDLDRFKIVNDSLGHLVGDKLLISVGHRLEACIRKVDTISRIGGDEFLVLQDRISGIEDAVRIAKRIKNDLEASFYVDGNEVFTRASIGIAVSSTNYKQPEDMIRDADTAMYRAKSLGGGNYQLFDPNMHTKAVALLQLESDLRRAVNQNDFVLHYQPIISLESGKILGLEALVRWPHPQKGLVMPQEFINLAEETGLIIPMGEQVLKVACAQLRLWQNEFPINPPLSMSVNISYKQLLQGDLVELVDRVIRESKIERHSLCLEITESGIMKNPDLVISIIKELKNLSVKVHMDDFGTGYSSLYYLHRFEIDQLKIDRSFVSHIGAAGEKLEVLQSMITLAHNLNIGVIAEGIETAEQLNYLRQMKCESGQGFLFCHGEEERVITPLLKKGKIN